MFNELFSHMNKMKQKDISLSLKVPMVQAKMNLYFTLLVYSRFYMKIDMPCTHISTKK